MPVKFGYQGKCYKCNEVIKIQIEEPVLPQWYKQFLMHSQIKEMHGGSAKFRNCEGTVTFNQNPEIIDSPVSQEVAQITLEAAARKRERPRLNVGHVNTWCYGCSVKSVAEGLWGTNKGLSDIRVDKKLIKETLGSICANVQNSIEYWGGLNCAEIDCVYKLLQRGVTRADIRVLAFEGGMTYKPPCENCQVWLVSCNENENIGSAYKIRPSYIAY